MFDSFVKFVVNSGFGFVVVFGKLLELLIVLKDVISFGDL